MKGAYGGYHQQPEYDNQHFKVLVDESSCIQRQEEARQMLDQIEAQISGLQEMKRQLVEKQPMKDFITHAVQTSHRLLCEQDGQRLLSREEYRIFCRIVNETQWFPETEAQSIRGRSITGLSPLFESQQEVDRRVENTKIAQRYFGCAGDQSSGRIGNWEEGFESNIQSDDYGDASSLVSLEADIDDNLEDEHSPLITVLVNDAMQQSVRVPKGTGRETTLRECEAEGFVDSTGDPWVENGVRPLLKPGASRKYGRYVWVMIGEQETKEIDLVSTRSVASILKTTKT